MKQIKMKSNRGRMSAKIYKSECGFVYLWKAVIDDDSGGLMNGSHTVYGKNDIEAEDNARVFMKSILGHSFNIGSRI
jgi:hypothetical protein